MAIRQRLDQLAVTVSLVDTEDKQALREILGYVKGLSADESVPEVLERTSNEASKRIESLLAGNDGDGEAVIDFLAEMVEFVSSVLDVLERGESAEAMLPPWEEDATAIEDSSIDEELLQLFTAECNDTLAEVEAQLLALEGQEDPAETIAEIRRRVHTFKGELGVLSLNVAQELCHEAETLIDSTEESGTIPVDLLLELVDWLGRHVAMLQESPTGVPDGHEALLAKLKSGESKAIELNSEAADESAFDFAIPAEPKAKVEPKVEPKVEEEPAGERITYDKYALEDETLPEFITETLAGMEQVESQLLGRSVGSDDVLLFEKLYDIFHTVKNTGGFFNLDPVVFMARKAEALLDEFRTDRMDCTTDHVDLVLHAKDMLCAMMNSLLGDQQPPLVSDLDLVGEQLRLAALGEPVQPHFLDHLYQVNADSALGGTTTQGQPEAESKAESEPIASAPEAKAAPEPTLAPASAAKSPEPVAAEPEPAPSAGLIPMGDETETIPASAPAADATAKKKSHRKPIASFVKVGTQRLDSLVDMVGELVIAQQMVAQEPALESINSEALARKLGHVAKITRDLQEGAMSLRMVTLKSTFQKMSRLVRDVARKSKKDVRLVLEGEDTELDRNVVEQIGDPLVHLIRNAVDHGLETSEDRVKAGKEGQGSLVLSAYHQGGSIVIEVRDNGRGLDCDRIFARAQERDLVPAGVTRSDISEEEIHRFIFQPGFSTAEVVSDISGRGVGMDVVRRNIEAMRGRIEIESEKGKGSTMSLRLPLTLAIIDGMIVRVGASRYVIPTLTIDCSFQPGPGQVHSVLGQGEVVDMRGALLPVYRVKQIFDLPSGADEATEGILLLLESNDKRACFLVDEILGQQQVVIKNLGKVLPQMQGVSGGAILGDGRVAIILDVDGIMAKAQGVLT